MSPRTARLSARTVSAHRPTPIARGDQLAAAPSSHGDRAPRRAEATPLSRAAETRYRIVLGDSCPVCRAASRISFTAERPPMIPVLGCHDAAGCRCRLPAFGEPVFLQPCPAVEEPRRADQDECRGAGSGCGPMLYDDATGAFSAAAFAAFGSAVVTETMRRGRALALIVVSLDVGTADGGGTEPELIEDGGPTTVWLRALADALRRAVRSSDIVARHGPRSLVLIAQNAEESGAMQVAQLVRAAIIERSIVDASARFQTVSQGIAALPQAGTSLTELIRRAEEAVGLAVSQGGNRIRVSGWADERFQLPVESDWTRTEAMPQGKLRKSARRPSSRLPRLIQAYDRGEIEGIVIKPRAGACEACLDAVQGMYPPRAAPSLPLSGCTGSHGCRCTYAAPKVDARRRTRAIQPAPADSAVSSVLEGG